MSMNRIDTGWYASQDGQYAVVADGYGYVTVDGQAEGFANDGWALVHDDQGRLRTEHNAGENVDWFNTKREAVAEYKRRTGV